VIKVAFCNPKKLVGSDVWVPEVLLTSSLDIKQFMFKLAMKSNACATMVKLIDVNLLTCLWCTLSTSKLLACSFPKYFKLAKIVMVQVLDNV
jgi:hypothetical protein